MATLLKQDKWYYSQFYSPHKRPRRKRIPLKTQTKQVAQHLHKTLEDRFAQGLYDPWTGYDATASCLPVSKHSQLQEVLQYYIEVKSRQDWRKVTTQNTAYVLKAFARFVGAGASAQELAPEVINEFLNRECYAYATKQTHKKKLLAFARWCARQRLVPYEYASVKVYNNDHEQEGLISYLSDQEIERLKSTIRGKVAADIERGYQNARRNAYWLLELIDWQRYSGMRVSETLSLRSSNFNTETWEVTIGSQTFTTKSKTKQVLPIGRVEPLKRLQGSL